MAGGGHRTVRRTLGVTSRYEVPVEGERMYCDAKLALPSLPSGALRPNWPCLNLTQPPTHRRVNPND